MHALIIEQEGWAVLMIEDELRKLGYDSFAFAVTADEALHSASAQCPDLITSDVRLENGPQMDAVCCARAIPIVFVTATGWEVRKRGSEAIMLHKPFRLGDLKGAISMATATRERMN